MKRIGAAVAALVAVFAIWMAGSAGAMPRGGPRVESACGLVRAYYHENGTSQYEKRPRSGRFTCRAERADEFPTFGRRTPA